MAPLSQALNPTKSSVILGVPGKFNIQPSSLARGPIPRSSLWLGWDVGACLQAKNEINARGKVTYWVTFQAESIACKQAPTKRRKNDGMVSGSWFENAAGLASRHLYRGSFFKKKPKNVFLASI